MNDIPSLEELIEEFSEIDDAMERLELLMDFADEVDELTLDEWVMIILSEAANQHMLLKTGKVWCIQGLQRMQR